LLNRSDEIRNVKSVYYLDLNICSFHNYVFKHKTKYFYLFLSTALYEFYVEMQLLLISQIEI